ncbi:MAG: BatA and WFA domain-containing protein [Bacteroidia bacterium]|nr:BatA and WFA domain-containing protein [Bacteroidia bacterium]
MAFLNPAALWGLLALSVPIIIHFFNLQRPKQILFSNVAFVKEVKKSVVRRVKFRQWLLLLARLLAITGLVFAFAGPVIVSKNNQLLRGNRSIALIIDNSYSMTAGNEKGEYFQQAISLARNIIRDYNREDEFLLMTTSDLRLNFNFSRQEEALEQLKDFSISQNIRSQSDILGFQDEIFSRASNSLREMYLLSDFQLSTVLADSQTTSMGDSLPMIKYIPLASRRQKNVYIHSHQVLSQIVEKGKPVTMSMQLVNDGETLIKDLSVRVMLEGKAAAINTKSLEPETESRVEVSFTPSESGWLSGYIELDDPLVDFDNRRYFTLYVPEKEKVLIVEGQPSRNIRLLYESLFEQFEPTFISARNIAAEEPSAYRSIILLGVKDISSGLGDKLRSFLEEGGSILFFPGDDMVLPGVNSFLSATGWGTMGPVVTLQEGAKASRVDLANPLFEGIFARQQTNVEFDAPNVFRYHTVQLNNKIAHNRILALENQAPILVESRIGNGLMFAFALFPGDAWTDFHVKTIFSPLIFRLTQIMNQTQNIQAGQEIGFYQPKSVRTHQKALINLIDSEGKSTPPEQYSQGGATILNFEKMDIREGNYIIMQENTLLEKIAFNVSDLESKLAYASESQLAEILARKGLEDIEILPPSADAIKTRIEVEKEGFPLWKYFIIIAVICLALEGMILLLRDKPVS